MILDNPRPSGRVAAAAKRTALVQWLTATEGGLVFLATSWQLGYRATRKPCSYPKGWEKPTPPILPKPPQGVGCWAPVVNKVWIITIDDLFVNNSTIAFHDRSVRTSGSWISCQSRERKCTAGTGAGRADWSAGQLPVEDPVASKQGRPGPSYSWHRRRVPACPVTRRDFPYRDRQPGRQSWPFGGLHHGS